MLKTRPTQRELLCSQVEVERLQGHVRKLRTRAKDARGHDPKDETKLERSTDRVTGNETLRSRNPSLAERIQKDKLLKTLRVKTEKSAMQHPYLKEKVHCYLFLDSTRLAKEQGSLPEADVVEQVGQICSDIVASCCYALEVEEIGELPRYVEKVRQLAQLSSVYQGFTERLTKLLKRFDVNIFGGIPTGPVTKVTYHGVLEEILSQVTDALVELNARREQMKPPGSKAHDVLLKSMKLISVVRINELVPTLRRSGVSYRCCKRANKFSTASYAFARMILDLLQFDVDNAIVEDVNNFSSVLH
ncbi:hypothetical protein BBO99_00001603 [Phytophthora kernoviae]|uniref:Centrosomal protein of 70 kDa n=1 Tax=Phytophthora kernoviae TaxID=325452 RepID=A0A421GZ28_9STRA|nr:hypothetical protein BBO99_00001603 [Phytophthora kernoviae]